MGYSLPAQKFGARMAGALAAGAPPGGSVRLNAWAIRERLLAILSEQYYQAALVGLPEMGLRMGVGGGQDTDALRGAEIWMDRVLDAARQTHARRPHHKGHELARLLMSAGEGWPETALTRAAERPGAAAPDGSPQKGVFARVERLRDADETPAPRARKDIGPLWFVVAALAEEAPEGLSLWGAVSVAPTRLAPFDEDALRALRMFLADAVNDANRHWAALKRLGLSPPDWMEGEEWEESTKFATLGCSQAMKCETLLSLAQASAAAEGRGAPDRADFLAAWAERPVTAKMDFEAFSATPAGRAILSTEKLSVVSADETLELTAEEEDRAADDLAAALQVLLERGAVEREAVIVFLRLNRGDTLAEILAKDAGLRARFRSLEPFRRYCETMFTQVLGAVRALEEGAGSAAGRAAAHQEG